jgi:hypothetical protein
MAPSIVRSGCVLGIRYTILVDGIPILVELAYPLRVVKLTVLIQSSDVSVAPDAGPLRVGIPQVALQIVGAGEARAALGHPAPVDGVLLLLVHGLFVAFLVLSSLEPLLLARVFVDALGVAAGELVLLDDQGTDHAGLGWDSLAFRGRSNGTLSLVCSSVEPVSTDAWLFVAG